MSESGMNMKGVLENPENQDKTSFASQRSRLQSSKGSQPTIATGGPLTVATSPSGRSTKSRRSSNSFGIIISPSRKSMRSDKVSRPNQSFEKDSIKEEGKTMAVTEPEESSRSSLKLDFSDSKLDKSTSFKDMPSFMEIEGDSQSSPVNEQEKKRHRRKRRRKQCCNRLMFRFKNQKLSGWRPIYRLSWILPFMISVGVSFLVLAGVLIAYANTVKELIREYTDCESESPMGEQNITTCAEYLKSLNGEPGDPCYCDITINLEEELEAPVILYYGLRNFLQDHRRFVDKWDLAQLRGEKTTDPPSLVCKPFDTVVDNDTGQILPIVPCGPLANSMFNDSFSLSYFGNSSAHQLNLPVPLNSTGICDQAAKKYMFGHPTGAGTLEEKYNGTVKPPNWRKHIYELDLENEDNNGMRNEDFIIWMSIASTNQFRKIYRKVDHAKAPFTNKLPPGKYSIHVEYNYPVYQFGAQKFIIITSSQERMGSLNALVGIEFLITSLAILVGSAYILLVNKKYSKTEKILRRDPNPAELEPTQFRTSKSVKE